MTSDLACRITDLPLWAERREPSIARQIERLAPLARVSHEAGSRYGGW